MDRRLTRCFIFSGNGNIEISQIVNLEIEQNQFPLKLNNEFNYCNKLKRDEMVRSSQGIAETLEIEYQNKIALKSDKPIRFCPRRLTYYEREITNKIVSDLLAKGSIKSSKSEYSSPIVLCRKKSNEYRLCVDYRELNKITLLEKSPLPVMICS